MLYSVWYAIHVHDQRKRLEIHNKILCFFSNVHKFFFFFTSFSLWFFKTYSFPTPICVVVVSNSTLFYASSMFFILFFTSFSIMFFHCSFSFFFSFLLFCLLFFYFIFYNSRVVSVCLFGFVYYLCTLLFIHIE